MELYIPYLIGSGVSAILGSVAYNFYYINDEIDDKDEIIKDEYDLMMEIPQKNNNRSLKGNSFREKTESLMKICKEECGLEFYNIKSKKTRLKLIRYIKEYETIGHDNFVKNHIKYNFKKELN